MKRIEDINKLIGKLDITPTMHINAIEKYKHLGEFLISNNLDIEFYPQGSIALGTVVRPYSIEKETSYDLDAICKLYVNKNTIEPKILKELIENTFENDKEYNAKLKVYDRCCTIQYADVNGVGFSIDIVTAVDEDYENKSSIKELSKYPEYVDTTIAIPSHEQEKYQWITNNPKGYKAWFDKINDRFLIDNPLNTKESILNENRRLFSSIEEIPKELQKTTLQRVIQLLKRHRDIYFTNKQKGYEIKPISVIITTLVTVIAENANSNMSTVELLLYVLNELSIYSEQQILNEVKFTNKYKNKKVIQRKEGNWKIENPVNPNDNLADAWNNDERLPIAFFKWCKVVIKDFTNIVNVEKSEYFCILENSFGHKFVKNNFSFGDYNKNEILDNTSIVKESKPWRKNNGYI